MGNGYDIYTYIKTENVDHFLRLSKVIYQLRTELKLEYYPGICNNLFQ